MPVFHKLLTLSFESDKEKGWQVVPLLLNNSPNLETLVIKVGGTSFVLIHRHTHNSFDCCCYMNFAFQGLVHRVTDRCGDACVCVARKNKEEEVCCLSTCQVKVLKVSGYRGTRRELNQRSISWEIWNVLKLSRLMLKLRVTEKTKMLTRTTRESPMLLLSFPELHQIHFFWSTLFVTKSLACLMII